MRRYVVTYRLPGEADTSIASRHFTLAAAQRRADRMRGLNALQGADVRARHITDLEH